MGDVDGFLERMVPGQMDAVAAYDRVHGVGLDRLIEIVASGLLLVANALGGEYEREDIDPWHQPQEASPEVVKAMFGET